MNTTLSQQVGTRQRRRRHSDEFKADLVAACTQPGISIAAVAMANGVDANLLRRWVTEVEMKPSVDDDSAQVAVTASRPPKRFGIVRAGVLMESRTLTVIDDKKPARRASWYEALVRLKSAAEACETGHDLCDSAGEETGGLARQTCRARGGSSPSISAHDASQPEAAYDVPMPPALHPSDGEPDHVPDRTERTLIKTWVAGWTASMAQAEEAVALGRRPIFLRLVTDPYPDNASWQRLNAIGGIVVTLAKAVANKPGVRANVLDDEVDLALAKRWIQREAAARAPKAQPASAEELQRLKAQRTGVLERTPEERQALLRALYADGWDGAT